MTYNVFADRLRQRKQYTVFGNVRARAQSDKRGSAKNSHRGVPKPTYNHTGRADRLISSHDQQSEKSHGLQSDAPSRLNLLWYKQHVDKRFRFHGE